MKCLIFFTDSCATQTKTFGDLLDGMMIEHELRPIGETTAPIAPQDLIDAQAAPLMIVAGTGQGADILRSIGSARGVLIDGPVDQPRALLGRMGVMLGRPGLGGWLAAHDAGAAHLVEWSKTNPGDPLAHSAALGVNPGRFVELIAEAGKAQQRTATPQDMPTEPETEAKAERTPAAPEPERSAQSTADQPAIEAQVTESEPISPSEALTDRHWLRSGLPYGAVTAAIAMLPLSLIGMGFTDFPMDKRVIVLVGALLLALAFGAGAVLAFRWSPPIGDEAKTQARFLYVARSAVVCAAIMPVVALLAVLAVWFSEDARKTDILGVLILLAVIAVLGLIIGGILTALALTLIRRISGLEGKALIAMGIATLPIAGLTLFYETESQRTKAIQAELTRAGLARCDALSTPEQLIRAAERRLHLPETGKYSAALMRAAKAMPDKTDWVLARDGSGDATNLADVLPFMCSDADDGKPVTLRIRPGTYTLPPDTPLNDGIHVVGEGKRDDIIVIIPNNADALSVGTGTQLRNLTVRSEGRREQSLVTIWGADVLLDGVQIVSNSANDAVSITGGESKVTRSTIRNSGGGALMIGFAEATEEASIVKAMLDDVTLAGGKGSGIAAGNDANLSLRNSRLTSQLYAYGNAQVTVTDGEITGETATNPGLLVDGMAKVEVTGSTLRANPDAYCAWVTGKGSLVIRDSHIGRCQPSLDFARVEKSGTLRLAGNDGQRVTRDRISVQDKPTIEVDAGSSAQAAANDIVHDREPTSLAPITGGSPPRARSERSGRPQVDYTE